MSHNTHAESHELERLKRAFIPSKIEILSLSLGSSFVLLVLNLLPAIRQFNGTNYALMTEYIREVMEKLLAPTNNQSSSVVLTIIFWMVVGMFVYIIIWIVGNLISNYRRDILNTKNMVLPITYNKNSGWHETFLRMLVRALSTIMFLYWAYLLFAGILPNASAMFLDSFNEFSIRSILQIIGSIIVLSLSVFVATVFARCIFLRERVFND